MLTAELYAIERDSSQKKGEVWYSDFYYHIELLKMCFVGKKIVKVRLTELEQPEDDCYWSWKKLMSNKLKAEPLDPPEFHFTHYMKPGVEICFAYGSKVEEDRGYGKLVPVKMELLHVET